MRAAGLRNYLGKDLGLLCGRQPSDLYLSVSSTQSGLRAVARFDPGQHQASYRAQGTHATSGRKKKCLVAPSDLVRMAWLSNSSDSSMITGKGKRRQIRRVRAREGETEKCTVESTDLQNNAPVRVRRRFLARLPLFLLRQSNQQRDGRGPADGRAMDERNVIRSPSFLRVDPRMSMRCREAEKDQKTIASTQWKSDLRVASGLQRPREYVL